MTKQELLDENWVYRKNIFDKKFYWYKDELELRITTYWYIVKLNSGYEFPDVLYKGNHPTYEQYKILMELIN